MAENATVTAYLSVPLNGERAVAGQRACAGARRRLAEGGGRAGEVRVRAICLDSTGGGRRWTLAAVGANARRAVEDSSTVAYIGELDPAASRFSRPILNAAGVPQISGAIGAAAMSQLLSAIERAPEGGSLRESVYDELR